MGERQELSKNINDTKLIRYFYLDKTAKEIVELLDSMKFELVESQEAIPFHAQVKSYIAAKDSNGDPWMAKPVHSQDEMVYHRSCLLSYLLDHETGTLAAPTSAVLIDGKKYRITKVVPDAVHISYHNYLIKPFIGILRADLINRWIFFDEDRNPNNYLVISNKANQPFVVAIDYDKSDLFTETMKITGKTEKFGWQRSEKTRFLTLLRPENFAGVSISEFEARLQAFAAIDSHEFLALALLAFKTFSADPLATAKLVTGNFLRRRDYVDKYFREMFKSSMAVESISHEEDYQAFGQSFLDMHRKMS